MGSPSFPVERINRVAATSCLVWWVHPLLCWGAAAGRCCAADVFLFPRCTLQWMTRFAPDGRLVVRIVAVRLHCWRMAHGSPSPLLPIAAHTLPGYLQLVACPPLALPALAGACLPAGAWSA